MKHLAAIVLSVLLIVTFCFADNRIVKEDGQQITKGWSVKKTALQIEPTTFQAPQMPVPISTKTTYKKMPFGLTSVGPNIRVLPTTNTTQSETPIIVSPTNPDILLGSANTTDWPVTQLFGTGYYISTDGGDTWTGSDIPPHSQSYCDPAVAIALKGYMYLHYLTDPQGVAISRSTDGGSNWDYYLIDSGPNLDKCHMTVDVSSTSPYSDYCYVAYTDFGQPVPEPVALNYSTNDGVNWSSKINISGNVALEFNQGVNLATGTSGEVYAVWAIYNSWPDVEDYIGFNVSTDGGATWGTASSIININGIRGYLKSPVIRVNSFPVLAVDRSGGSNHGALYVVWTQRNQAPAGSDPDILLSKSTDGGDTWGSPVRVNDDGLNNGKDQWFPWVTVDQSNGKIHVVFYDSRNSTDNQEADIYLATSADGGATFTNIKVTSSMHDPEAIPGLATGYTGDYIGVAAADNVAWPFWCDNRTGNYQAYVSTVTVCDVSADFYADPPTSGCAPLGVQFYDNSTGPVISYTWYFGDGDSADVADPYHVYSTPGTYDVTLTVCSSTCCDSKTETDYIDVWGPPVADFSGNPTEGPAPLEVTFTNLTQFHGSATWDWDFGDGQHSYVQDPPPHTYENPGYYTVKLTVTDDCGTDIEEKIDYIHATEVQPVKDYANQDIPVSGTVSGTYTDTHVSDNVYESITEVESKGKPDNRYSLLEHKWTIEVTGGQTVTFYVEAYQSASTDGDSFDFEYSTNDDSYSYLLTVNSTSEMVYSAGLPNTLSGTVYIRLTDTNQTPGNRALDTIYIDHMYIESVPGPPVPEVVYNSHTVDDGGNGVLDPGETSDLIVTLENIGGADATNVAAILSTNDSYITIDDNSGTYGNIVAGGTADNAADPYNVTADAGTPMGHVVEFYLDITADGGYTNADTFYLAVGQQAMHVNSIDMSIELTKTAGKNKFYQATATVTIVDAGDSPVESAWVYGQWSGETSDSDSGLTDANGQVALTSDEKKNPTSWFKFCVTDVQKSGWVYDSGANVESCDSIMVGGAKVADDVLPTSFSLLQNYPNPFNPETDISYAIPTDCLVRLEVYNLLGQRVTTLIDTHQPSGIHSVRWDASDVSTGIYFYRITAGEFTAMKRMVLMK